MASDQKLGGDRAGEPIAEPEIQERPADERVRAADELRDLDLDAAVVDLEPDRIADHDRRPRARAAPSRGPRCAPRARASPAAARPIAVSSCTRSVSGSAPIAAARPSTSPAAPLAGRTTSVSRQRIACRARRAPSPKPECARNSSSAVPRSIELHAPDVGPRRDLARERPRPIGRHVELEVDGEVRRALPASRSSYPRLSRARAGRPATRARSRSRARSAASRTAGGARRRSAPTRLCAMQPEVVRAAHRLSVRRESPTRRDPRRAQPPVGHVLDQLEVVRGDQQRDADLVEAREQLHDLEREIGIEIAGRLVGDQHVGPRARRARAMPTRCCSPVESVIGACVSRPSRPDLIERGAHALARSRGGSSRRSRAAARRCRTPCGRRAACDPGTRRRAVAGTPESVGAGAAPCSGR